jgi:hypothetical protein
MKVGDKVYFCDLQPEIKRIANGMAQVMGTWIDTRYLKLVMREEKPMEIKVNWKVMTEEEKQDCLLDLFSETYNAGANKNKSQWVGTASMAIKAMEICRNEPGEVESVELTFPDDVAVFDNQCKEMKLRLMPDQIRQIQAIKL